MNKIIIDDPILYRTQCKKCSSILSLPFEYDYDEAIKGDIKVDKFKGHNIFYSSITICKENQDFFESFAFCVKCREKIGYLVPKAVIFQVKYTNKLFFFQKKVNLIKYEITEENKDEYELLRNQDKFYNSKYLSKEAVNYAKENIDKCLQNIQKYKKTKKEIETSLSNINKKIKIIKDLFAWNLTEKDNANHLGLEIQNNQVKKKNSIKKSVIDDNNEEERILNELNTFFNDEKGVGKNNINEKI